MHAILTAAITDYGCDLLIPWSRTSLSQNRAFAVVGHALCNIDVKNVDPKNKKR